MGGSTLTGNVEHQIALLGVSIVCESNLRSQPSRAKSQRELASGAFVIVRWRRGRQCACGGESGGVHAERASEARRVRRGCVHRLKLKREVVAKSACAHGALRVLHW